jgi:glycosyltransferase involved in cell wall biosynthesis
MRPLETASGRRGVGTYLRGLVSALLALRGEDEILLFHSSGAPGPPPALAGLGEGATAVPLTRPRRITTLWDQLAWPITLSRLRVDVFHSPFWVLPVMASKARGLVQTIHDLTPLKIPGSVSFRNRLVFRANFACARSASRIIVPSRATEDDVESMLGIPKERIRRVPEAITVEPGLMRSAATILPGLRRRLEIPGRYLLHTGGHDPVKDLPTAVEAAAILVRSGQDLRLVVTGEAGGGTDGLRRRAEAAGIADRLVLTGFVERGELIALYHGAAALIYPSLNEGFGLPLLEAMACGTPAVAAGAGALPEVGGEACLFAPPRDAARFAQALALILTDDALARFLGEAGRKRAAEFSWREAAARTMDVYREAAA